MYIVFLLSLTFYLYRSLNALNGYGMNVMVYIVYTERSSDNSFMESTPLDLRNNNQHWILKFVIQISYWNLNKLHL